MKQPMTATDRPRLNLLPPFNPEFISSALFFSAFATLAYWSLRKFEFDLFAIIELITLVGAGSCASASYSKLRRDIDNLVNSRGIVERLDLIEYHHIFVSLSVLASFFAVTASTEPYVLPFVIAVIYFTYCVTNYRVCGIIRRNNISKKNGLLAATVLVQNYSFLAEENWISLVAYVMVVALAYLATNAGSVFPAPKPEQLTALVAGMAVFHLTVSAIRFRAFASRKPDQTLVGELIKAYDAHKKPGAKPGRDMFITLFGHRIERRSSNLKRMSIIIVALSIALWWRSALGFLIWGTLEACLFFQYLFDHLISYGHSFIDAFRGIFGY